MVIAFLRRVVPGLAEADAQLRATFHDDEYAPPLAQVLLRPDAESALAAAGVGQPLAQQVAAAWRDACEDDPTGIEAALRGLGDQLWRRARARFGGDIAYVAARTPYRLASVPGLGWRAADRVALGVARLKTHSVHRISAALDEALGRALADGHCFLPPQVAYRRASDVAAVPEDVVAVALDDRDALAELLPHVRRDRAGRFWREELFEAEAACAAELRRLVTTARAIPTAEAERLARAPAGLTDEQRRAVVLALTEGVSALTGGPGTGKTTAIRAICQAAESAGLKPVRVCAPTALAARRLGEAGTTIHRLIEWGRGELREDEQTPYRPSAGRHAGRPVTAGLAIVDESTMVDLVVASRLLLALPDGCHLVLAGDPDQLPSVGPGQLLLDLLAAGVPHVSLTQVFRFGSHLARAAHAVREGRVPDLARKYEPDAEAYFCPAGRDPAGRVVELVTRRIPERFGIPAPQVKALSPRRQGPAGTKAIAEALRAALGSDAARAGAAGFFPGDKLLWGVNDYRLGLVNGDEVVVVSGSDDGALVVENYAGEEIKVPSERVKASPATCITIHSAQGSQQKAVVPVIVAEHAYGLHRALVYTALTRATDLAVVVADEAALAAAVGRSVGRGRNSLLAARLTPWPTPETG